METHSQNHSGYRGWGREGVSLHAQSPPWQTTGHCLHKYESCLSVKSWMLTRRVTKDCCSQRSLDRLHPEEIAKYKSKWEDSFTDGSLRQDPYKTTLFWALSEVHQSFLWVTQVTRNTWHFLIIPVPNDNHHIITAWSYCSTYVLWRAVSMPTWVTGNYRYSKNIYWGLFHRKLTYTTSWAPKNKYIRKYFMCPVMWISC